MREARGRHDGGGGATGSGGGALLTPGERLAEFEIEDDLDSGGFGVTYLAQDLLLHRRVAIKEYFPLHWGSRRRDGSVGPRTAAQADDYAWGLSRFLQEARMLAQPRLRHANLVQVHRILEGNGTAYLVTEFVEGRSLEKALDSEGPWREDRVRSLLSGLLDGLSAVHSAGLVHRDIKPGNVMLRAPDDTPVLIDFGAARYATGEKSGTLTEVLTPGYAPFEQYHGRGRQGPWTDIYALGAVAYRALSGRKPVEAPARVDGVDPLRPVREVAAHRVSESMASAVDGALAVRSPGRPQSVGALRDMLAGKRGTGRQGGGASPEPAWRRDVGGFVAALVGNIVVFFVTGWLVASDYDRGGVTASVFRSLGLEDELMVDLMFGEIVLIFCGLSGGVFAGLVGRDRQVRSAMIAAGLLLFILWLMAAVVDEAGFPWWFWIVFGSTHLLWTLLGATVGMRIPRR